MKKVNKLLACQNVRLAHSNVHSIYDNSDRIQENGKYSGNIKCQKF